MSEIQNKCILIYGGGVSGNAAAKYLAGKGGAHLLFYDDNGMSAPPADTLDVRGENEAEIISKSSLVIVSPSVKLDAPLIRLAKKHSVAVDTEMSFGASLLPSKKIAVTGTDGKTTVTSAVTAMLKKSAVKAEAMGNIGAPVTSFLLNPPDTAVIEVSSFQLAWGKSFHPDAAVIINIAPDHLNWHPDFAHYLASKYRIFEYMDSRDTIVLNADDYYSKKAGSLTRSKAVYFSVKKKADARIEKGIICLFDEKLMPVQELKHSEGHHLSNALCAALTAYISGAGTEAVKSVLSEFSPPPHRMELIYEKDGLKIFNDSKATTPHATISAIGCVSGSIALILGGSDKGEDYAGLFNEIAEKKIYAFCIGSNQRKMEDAAKAAGAELRCFNVLSDALKAAIATGADNVLFSPASASFDRYKNYEERGNVFKTLVKEILLRD